MCGQHAWPGRAVGGWRARYDESFALRVSSCVKALEGVALHSGKGCNCPVHALHKQARQGC